MFKRVNLWYCLPPFLILCVFVAALSFVYSQYGSFQQIVARIGTPDGQIIELNEEEYAKFLAEQNATEEMYETIRMMPIARRVLLLSTETLDESFLKLGTYDDGQYFEPGYSTNAAGVYTNLHVLLSNRRVIKVLQEFEKLPLDQAKIKAKEFHKIALGSLSKRLDVEPAPYSPEIFYAAGGSNEQFMAMTSVLLSASLGDIPFVMQQIEEWEQICMKKREQLVKKNYPPDIADFLSQCSFLDPTSFVSILMFAQERSGKDIPVIVKNKIAETYCQIVNVPLVTWYANKTYYDDLRHQGGGNFSWENIQMVFRVYTLHGGIESRIQESQELVQFVKETLVSKH